MAKVVRQDAKLHTEMGGQYAEQTVERHMDDDAREPNHHVQWIDEPVVLHAPQHIERPPDVEGKLTVPPARVVMGVDHLRDRQDGERYPHHDVRERRYRGDPYGGPHCVLAHRPMLTGYNLVKREFTLFTRILQHWHKKMLTAAVHFARNKPTSSAIVFLPRASMTIFSTPMVQYPMQGA